MLLLAYLRCQLIVRYIEVLLRFFLIIELARVSQDEIRRYLSEEIFVHCQWPDLDLARFNTCHCSCSWLDSELLVHAILIV